MDLNIIVDKLFEMSKEQAEIKESIKSMSDDLIAIKTITDENKISVSRAKWTAAGAITCGGYLIYILGKAVSLDYELYTAQSTHYQTQVSQHEQRLLKIEQELKFPIQ